MISPRYLYGWDMNSRFHIVTEFWRYTIRGLIKISNRESNCCDRNDHCSPFWLISKSCSNVLEVVFGPDSNCCLSDILTGCGCSAWYCPQLSQLVLYTFSVPNPKQNTVPSSRQSKYPWPAFLQIQQFMSLTKMFIMVQRKFSITSIQLINIPIGQVTSWVGTRQKISITTYVLPVPKNFP